MRLIGKNGDIHVDEQTGTAFIKNAILKAKYGETVSFPLSDLHKWIGRLKIEGTDNGQLRFGQW